MHTDSKKQPRSKRDVAPTTTQKTLLVVAHKKEAEAFLKWMQWKKRGGIWPLYEEKEHYLCLTGEGRYASLCVLSSVLEQLKGQIEKVVNVGIAGGLCNAKKVRVGQVYAVRTAYGYEDKTPIFKSYSCERPTALFEAVDCISIEGHKSKASGEKRSSAASVRSKLSEELAHYAHVVDRELWSIAYASAQRSLPVYSLKMVSDLFHEKTPTKKIMEQADLYSETLWRSYQELKKQWKDADTSQCGSRSAVFTSQSALHKEVSAFLDSFPMTFSQHKQIHQLLLEWCLAHKQKLNKLIQVKEMASILSLKTLTGKQRATKIIDYLCSQLDPLLHKAKGKMLDFKKQLRQKGIHLSYDTNFAQKEIELRFRVSTERELRSIIDKLSMVPMAEMRLLLEGKKVGYKWA